MNSHPDYELEVVRHMQQAVQSEVGRFRIASGSRQALAGQGLRGRLDRALVRLGHSPSERLPLAENK
jgi:hypothetical protein